MLVLSPLPDAKSARVQSLTHCTRDALEKLHIMRMRSKVATYNHLSKGLRSIKVQLSLFSAFGLRRAFQYELGLSSG